MVSPNKGTLKFRTNKEKLPHLKRLHYVKTPHSNVSKNSNFVVLEFKVLELKFCSKKAKFDIFIEIGVFSREFSAFPYFLNMSILM